jgi:hypothetical protein
MSRRRLFIAFGRNLDINVGRGVALRGNCDVILERLD